MNAAHREVTCTATEEFEVTHESEVVAWMLLCEVAHRRYSRAEAASEAYGAKRVPSSSLFAIAEELHPCIASCVDQQTPSWAALDSERSRRFLARGMGKGPSSSLLCST